MAKKTVLLTFVFLMMLSSSVMADHTSSGFSFTHRFHETPQDHIEYAKSPARSSGLEVFPYIISKINQPRKVGSNPHGGSDLRMSGGTPVYNILPGVIVDWKDEGSGNGWIYVNHDINGDGTPDGIYGWYIHVRPNTKLTKNKYYDADTLIATVDGSPSAPHLHLELREGGTKTHKNYPYYRHVSDWRNGSDMDFISKIRWSGDTLYIDAYANSDYSCGTSKCADRFPLKEVKMYYRVDNQSWSDSRYVQMRKESDYTWYYDQYFLGSLYSTVDYYIAGHRDPNNTKDDTFYGATYTHGLYPAYYQHPPEKPSQFTSAIQYRSNVIGMH